MHSIPTLIIGGGIAGASLASALAERGAGEGVTIVDIDLFGRYGSSATSAGGVHVMSDHPLDVSLATQSIEFLRSLGPRIDFRQVGSLRLCPEARWNAVRQTAAASRVETEALSPAQIAARYPFIGRTDDLAGGLLTPGDGYLSLHKLRMHYLNRAQARGVSLMDHWQVASIEGTASAVRVTLRGLGARSVRKALTQDLEKGGELVIEAGRVINAAGPWAGRIAALYGRRLPITPSPSHVFMIRHPQFTLEGQPFIIDATTGIEIRQAEFDRKPCLLIDAPSTSSEARIDFTTADFKHNVEPRVTARFPALAGGEVLRAWVSHDEKSSDGRAVVGPVTGASALFNFNGFSEVAYCHPLAQAMADLLTNRTMSVEPAIAELSDSRFDVPTPQAAKP